MKRRFAQALLQENPTLFDLFSLNSERVVLTEDQTGYGYQSGKRKIFLDYLAGGESKTKLICLCSGETPSPSWQRDKELQGIKLVPYNHVSLTSHENPTEKSERFYAQLKDFAFQQARKRRRRPPL